MRLTIVFAYVAAVAAGGCGFLVSIMLFGLASPQLAQAAFLFVGMLISIPFAALVCLRWSVAAGLSLHFLHATSGVWFAIAGALVDAFSFAAPRLLWSGWQSSGSSGAPAVHLAEAGTLAGCTCWRIAIRRAPAGGSRVLVDGRVR